MIQHNTDIFEEDLKTLGIILSDGQLSQFIRYFEMLTEWNKMINLTAITEYDEVMKKHFVDSLTLVKVYDTGKPSTVIDVGTGAGFPGLALKIAFPHLKVTLLDSLNKRIQFLDNVIEKLCLTEVKTIHGRAEDYAKRGMLREKFDLCVSRAVANLSVLSEYCIPFVRQGGKFIPYKSENISEEISAAEHAISVLGGNVENVCSFHLPNSDICRSLPVIEKKRQTPVQYPRKSGLPSRNPLV